jgi:hypothetical protein
MYIGLIPFIAVNPGLYTSSNSNVSNVQSIKGSKSSLSHQFPPFQYVPSLKILFLSPSLLSKETLVLAHTA